MIKISEEFKQALLSGEIVLDRSLVTIEQDGVVDIDMDQATYELYMAVINRKISRDNKRRIILGGIHG